MSYQSTNEVLMCKERGGDENVRVHFEAINQEFLDLMMALEKTSPNNFQSAV